MTSLDIYRTGLGVVCQINIDESTTFSHRLMNEHKISCETISSSVLLLQIGDYITFNGEDYFINRIPNIEKVNSSTYKYKIQFEAVIYDLNKKLFMSSDDLSDFSYSGTAEDFIDSIISNINSISSGWTKGTVDVTDQKLLYFTNESCRAALTKVAEAFDLEFSLSGREISLVASVGSVTAYSFTYGRASGLYKLERQQVSDQNIITRVFGFGGTRNIPYDYRDRAKRLVFDYYGNRYLEKNTATYGVIEGQFTDDDIYPKRTSTLTDVNMVYDTGDSGTDFNPRSSYVEDSAIDFDINDYLIPGLTAKISFKSGDLAGVECEIWKYDAANKRIYFNPYTDQDGYTLPFYNGGSPIYPGTGDSYTLVDMEMPDAYVATAEADLMAATQAYLDENSVPMVIYSLELDPKYIKDNSVSIDAGDKVTIVDAALSINSLIRVSAIEFPLVDTNKIKATIADFVPYTQAERTIKSTISNKQNILEVDRVAEEVTRKVSLALHQEMGKHKVPMYQGVFDPYATYYGNPARRDIVRYDPGAGELYYVTKINAPSESFDGIVPTNTDYWERFDATFNSIATNLLFADLALIENLAVRYFQGIPIDAGNLAGTVATIPPDHIDNVIAYPQISHCDLSGTSGTANVSAGGVTRLATWVPSSLALTAAQFVTDWAADYSSLTGITVTSDDITIVFTGADGVTFSTDIENVSGNLDGSFHFEQEAQTAVARKDTITLTGDSGEADILCDAVTKRAYFNVTLTQSAADFVAAYASDYLTGGVVVTSSGANIIFTAQVPGTDFTGSTTITNVPLTSLGAIKIEGNQIWEYNQNADNGAVHINYKGYNGGVSKFRTLRIGNGKGTIIARFYGDTDGAIDNTIHLQNAKIIISDLPTSSAGLSTGQLWKDSGTIKIV